MHPILFNKLVNSAWDFQKSVINSFRALSNEIILNDMEWERTNSCFNKNNLEYRLKKVLAHEIRMKSFQVILQLSSIENQKETFKQGLYYQIMKYIKMRLFLYQCHVLLNIKLKPSNRVLSMIKYSKIMMSIQRSIRLQPINMKFLLTLLRKYSFFCRYVWDFFI